MDTLDPLRTIAAVMARFPSLIREAWAAGESWDDIAKAAAIDSQSAIEMARDFE